MTNLKNDHREGETTKEIEKQTSKIPSGVFLAAAIVSMGGSLTLKLMNRSKTALFVGQWAASFLLLGIYNKIVKLEGHDKSDQNPN
ncbi:hypothetical protein GILI108418_15815 [Gillisia limnaea]|uniref:Uncharacterized protein n=2 Tax=Gillisia TaxID=244698 RepID=H2BR10_GILLR|nr:hypothetical protein Gilli_0172 [Gillisia limnaea DSM 15749]